jgi:hypothetical protein
VNLLLAAAAQVRDLALAQDFFYGNSQVKVWEGRVEGVRTIFLEPTNGSVWVGCIYGRNDDAARFGFFCGAAVEYLKHHAGGLCAQAPTVTSNRRRHVSCSASHHLRYCIEYRRPTILRMKPITWSTLTCLAVLSRHCWAP